MGKLRDSLTQLSGAMANADKQAEEVCGGFQKLATSASDASQMVTQGYGVLYQYVFEKYKKKGDSIGAHTGDALSTLNDATVSAFIKGIEKQRPVAIKTIGQRQDLINGGVKSLIASLDAVTTKAGEISGVIAKKKTRWLKSKKFKDKMKGYEAQLEATSKTAWDLKSELKTMIQGFKAPNDDVYTKPITESTTVGELTARTNKIDRTMIASFNAAVDQGARRIRERNHFSTQVANIRKWVGEADEMEAEGD